MIKKLKALLRPKDDEFKLGHLPPGDLAKLKELRAHPHWNTYLQLLDRVISFVAEDMLNASDVQAVLHYRSAILGIRRAGVIVDELIAEEAKDARRDEAGTKLSDERIAAATFGTPYWGW